MNVCIDENPWISFFIGQLDNLQFTLFVRVPDGFNAQNISMLNHQFIKPSVDFFQGVIVFPSKGSPSGTIRLFIIYVTVKDLVLFNRIETKEYK